MFKVERKKNFLVIIIMISVGLIIAPFGGAFAQDAQSLNKMTNETSTQNLKGMENGELEQYADRMPTEGRTPEKMIFDLTLVRTTGIIGVLVGTTAFVLSFPFSGLGGNTEEAYQRLVVDPAKYTFNRPLGAF